MWIRSCVTSGLLTWTLFFSHASGMDVLKNNGFSTCLDSADIKVDRVNLSFDRSTKTITFDVAGSSTKSQKVIASLVISAYGHEFTQEFDPCVEETKVEQLCPIPAGNFAARGDQRISSDFADKIPSVAFSLPDLDAQATLVLKAKDGGESVACIKSVVGNGKTLEVPAVSYVAAGVAGAALIMTGLSALGSAGHAGAATSSPTFGEVLGWLQSLATNGMLSVNYPSIYRSFTKNFAFSTGLVPWNQMQASIDHFRNVTGGNLTNNNVEFLRNATLIYSDGSNSTVPMKRSLAFVLDSAYLSSRGISTSVNGTVGNDVATSNSGVNHFVKGIQGYVEQLSIPKSNTFMTVLMVFAIVVAAIVVGILLFKVILEAWTLCGSFPAKLTNFRNDYWGLMARTITNLILILYGVWTLYCIFQFTNGDSWAAKLLAGLTLGIFTATLGYFTFRIWRLARRYKKMEGDVAALYENKETWRRYSLFYDCYKKGYWWLFVPTIVYMFARGCIIAGGDGYGMAQSIGQLAVEVIMLILLLWTRPYVTKSGQWINILIQIVRVLSVACILVFVQQLGISQTTKTVTGIVLIVVQSTLTGLLAILIVINGLMVCLRKNPHRRRKENEKLNRDLHDLEPLDSRRIPFPTRQPYIAGREAENGRFNFPGPYEPYRETAQTRSRHTHTESSDHLLPTASGMGHSRSVSHESAGDQSPERDPMRPDLERQY